MSSPKRPTRTVSVGNVDQLVKEVYEPDNFEIKIERHDPNEGMLKKQEPGTYDISFNDWKKVFNLKGSYPMPRTRKDLVPIINLRTESNCKSKSKGTKRSTPNSLN